RTSSSISWSASGEAPDVSGTPLGSPRQGAVRPLRAAAPLRRRGLLSPALGLLLLHRPRLLRDLRVRREHLRELLSAALRRSSPRSPAHRSSPDHASLRRGAKARHDRAPLHLSAPRRRDLSGEADRLLSRSARSAGGGGDAARLPLSPAAVPDRARPG